MPIRYMAGPPKRAEVVVIGGGIVGAATAFHARRAGLDPVILESRPALASLTTAAAAGGLRLQLDDEDEFRLVSETVELLTHFAEVTGQSDYDAGLREQGYLWATTAEDGATVTVFADDGSGPVSIGTAVATGGSWTFTPTTALTVGSSRSSTGGVWSTSTSSPETRRGRSSRT